MRKSIKSSKTGIGLVLKGISRESIADCQSRSDSVYTLWSKRSPAHMLSRTPSRKNDSKRVSTISALARGSPKVHAEMKNISKNGAKIRIFWNMQILGDGKVRKMGFLGKNRWMTSDLMGEEKGHSMPHNGRNGGIASRGQILYFLLRRLSSFLRNLILFFMSLSFGSALEAFCIQKRACS